MGDRNLLQSMGPQALCKVKVDHGEESQHMLQGQSKIVGNMGSHHDTL
jgi:hypothetical protein